MGVVTPLRRERAVIVPSQVVNREVLEVLGEVTWIDDGNVVVRCRSRQMELVLDGLVAYWDRREREGWVQRGRR